MNIKLVTYFDANMAPIGKMTSGILYKYAARHGYAAVCQTSAGATESGPAWNKIALVRQVLNCDGSDWVMWLDADAVIMNPEIKIENIIAGIPQDKDAAFATDDNGLCSGVFLIKKSQWSLSFLDTVWFLKDINFEKDYGRGGRKWEQNCIKGLFKHFKSVANRIHLLPQRAINSYEQNFEKDDFILHLASCPNELRVAKLTQLLKTLE